MEVPFHLKKAEEAMQLVAEARELVFRYRHFRHAGEEAITRLQGILSSILQCTSLAQAYDESPHRCAIYAHVSRTFLRVIDFPHDRPHVSGHPPYQQPQQYKVTAETPACTSERDGEEFGAAILYPPEGNEGLGTRGNTNGARWADVKGCEDAIAALKRATVLPLRFPHLFQGKRVPPSRILLYGPPGTGKTTLAAAAASEYAAPLLTISSADILSKWIGDSERLVRRVFEVAASFPRCVLFLDEIDAIGGVRGGVGESEVSRRVKTELLLCMQKSAAGGVTFVAATNIPWGLDSAILRRFDQLVFVGLPSPSARYQLIVEELKDVPNELSNDDLHWLIDSTDGYSASDIGHIVQRAIMEPIQKISLAGYAKPITRPPVTESDGIVAGVALASKELNVSRLRYVPCEERDEGAQPIEAVPATALQVQAVGREAFELALREFLPTTSAAEMERFLGWGKRGN